MSKTSCVADHCLQYSLSDPRDRDFQVLCDHQHTDQCDRCDAMAEALLDIKNALAMMTEQNIGADATGELRVTDSKCRESLDRLEKSKTLKLCLKNAFREFSSKILFRFSKNLTSSSSQKTKIHLFTSLNTQKISGKLTKFSVFALKQFTILEHGINLAQKFHLSSIYQ